MKEKELKFILQEGEGYRLEFKLSFSSAIAKEMVAFANAEGGRIVLGVDDENNIVGIQNNNRLISQIQDVARNCEPSIKMTVSLEQSSGKSVLIIEIPEGEEKPYSCSEGYFLRVGANSQKMRRNELLEFIRRIQPYCFDEQPCDAFSYPGDFDVNAFRLFLSKSGIAGSKLKIVDILQNLGVAKVDKKGRVIFSNGGVLFFAKDPIKFIRQAKVTCLLLAGIDKVDILDRKDLESNLAENVEQSMVFLKRHLSLRYKIDKLRREEILELPETALREAILNAVTHRDYSERGAVVMVEIYRDRVEISDPGGLPLGLKRSELGRRSVHRNPLLADLFHRLGEVEKVGSGIGRIRNATKTANVPSPLFEVNGFFTVIFPKPPGIGSHSLADTGQVPDKCRTSASQVLEFCRAPRKASEIQEYLGLKHRETFQNNYIKPLIKRAYIRMTISDKPKSNMQKYITTAKGIKFLKELKK